MHCSELAEEVKMSQLMGQLMGQLQLSLRHSWLKKLKKGYPVSTEKEGTMILQMQTGLPVLGEMAMDKAVWSHILYKNEFNLLYYCCN